MKKIFALVIRWGMICFFAYHSLVFANGAPTFLANLETELDSPDLHVFSLKALQKRLQSLPGPGNIPDSLQNFGGITKIIGYVIDSTSGDILIVGNANPELPALYLEDFVIALRNVWHIYVKVEGNKSYYAYPSCTIDPNPRTMRRLNQVFAQINRVTSEQDVDKLIEQWHTTCLEYQKVDVFGIPFDTRFASIMVKADYDLKKIADGSDELSIPGLTSIPGMHVAAARTALQNGQPITISTGGLNRFWFYSGENRLQESADIVLIEACPVLVSTEQMGQTKSGQYIAGKRVNPVARDFTEAFVRSYEDICRLRPIYQELEGLFRFVALAKIMKYKNIEQNSGLSIDFFLNDYPIGQETVARQVKGRSAVEEFTNVDTLADGIRTVNLWLPSCGGVDIDISIGQKQFQTDLSTKLKLLKSEVIASRPSANRVIYRLRKRKKSKDADQNQLHRINQDARDYAVLSLEKIDVGYILSDGINQVNCRSVEEVLNSLGSRFRSLNKENLIIDIKNFTPDKLEGLRASMAIQLKANSTYRQIKVLPRPANGGTEIRDFLTNPRLEMIRAPEPRILQLGHNRYKGVVDFFIRSQTRTKQFTLEFISESRRALREFINQIMVRKGNALKKKSTLLDDILEIQRGLDKKGWKDVKTSITSEIGSIEFSVVPPDVSRPKPVGSELHSARYALNFSSCDISFD